MGKKIILNPAEDYIRDFDVFNSVGIYLRPATPNEIKQTYGEKVYNIYKKWFEFMPEVIYHKSGEFK